MGTLTLTVLGNPNVVHAGVPLRFPTRKTLALLVFLAVEGGLQRRERLVDLLWPEADEEHGRMALRTTLRFLRAALRHPGGASGDEHLVRQGDAVGFAVGAEPTVDLRDVQDASRIARAPYNVTPVQLIPRLGAAAAQCRGEFLEGFSLPDSMTFDDWSTAQRQYWQQATYLVLDRLTQWQLESGATAEAQEWAQRWVALDPLSEPARRRLMQLQLLAGDRSAALRSYARLRALLRRELDATPDAATEALARRAKDAPATAQAYALALGDPKDTPLVGRSEEFARLAAVYRRAAAGRPQLALLEGEAGIGKTRLAAEFLTWAAGQGAGVVAGKAFETGGRLPYQPIAEALRRRLESEPAHGVALLPPSWRGPLALLLPEWREAAGPPQQRGAEASSLAEAVIRLFRALAGPQALLVFLDDLHWADAASLDLLHYCTHSLALTPAPMLLLLSVRAEEIAERADLRQYLRDIARDLALHRLALDPLSQEATTQLLQVLGDSALTDFGERIFEESGGHPQFILETARFWREHGPPSGPGRMLAPGVREAIQARLALLGSAAAAVMAAAAVVGGRLDFPTIQAVCELPEATCLQGLEELVRRRLLQPARPGYVFGHDNMRLVAYEEAGEARRWMLHRRALQALELAERPAGELLPHALALQQAERIYELSLRAGDEALALSAGVTAIQHYERAQELGVQPGDAITLYRNLGDAYRLVDRLPAVVQSYRRMLASARAGGRPREECQALCRLALVLAQDFATANDDPERLAREALTTARADGHPRLITEALTTLGLVLMYGGQQLDEGARAATEAVTLARECDDAAPEGAALTAAAQLDLFVGNWTDSVEQGKRASALYQALGNRSAQANGLAMAASAEARLGQFDAALEMARQALSISRDLDNAWGIATALFAEGEIFLLTGRWREALVSAHDGLAAAQRSGFLPLVSLQNWLAGGTQRVLGDLDAAAHAYEEARRTAAGLPIRVFEEMSWSGLCATKLMLGDVEGAARCVREARQRRSQSSPFGAYARWSEVVALAQVGLLDDAGAELAELQRLAERAPLLQCSLARGRAALAGARGDHDQALQQLRQAQALASAAPLPFEQCECMLAQAELLPDERHDLLARLQAVLADLDPSGEMGRRWPALPRVAAVMRR